MEMGESLAVSPFNAPKWCMDAIARKASDFYFSKICYMYTKYDKPSRHHG